MNVLLLSVGTRNKIVQYFKKTINGKVYATDMKKTAPALYESDEYFIVPSIDNENYITTIVDICKRKKIDCVLSLIDPELSLLAKNEDVFKEINVKIVGSNYEACDLSLNKWKMYLWLRSHGYKCAKTYININEFYKDINESLINYPVFVKPIEGSASLFTTLVYDREMLEYLFSNNKNLLIQEYLKGQEIGADVYIDSISNEVISIFTKKKIAMRAGETDKAVSFKDKTLFELIKKFCNEVGYKWQIDIDLFKINDEYYISEVNPRFGGGYPHAYECGCNHMKYIENNVNNVVNKIQIGNYEENIYMMKYNEIKIMK